MDSNKAQEIGHDLETYGYDKSVDNGARWYGIEEAHEKIQSAMRIARNAPEYQAEGLELVNPTEDDAD